MPLVVAEDHPENFGALTQTRATFELRYGALSPLERALQITDDVVLRVRPELENYLRAKTGLRVNEDIEGEPFPGLPAATPWEILARSEADTATDFRDWQTRHSNCRESALMTGAHIVGDARDVFIGRGSVVQPGCVLDASGGPIILAENVTVKASQITGPVFVGAACTVDGARLRPGTSLGPNCKVGGEIAATIFQSRVNKGHEGFVGHSWVGRWVNFGALATTSNLKNTYGTIQFPLGDGENVATGAQFLGSIIGDHSKIGILQGLTTGSNFGVGCNIFGGGIAPKWVPSFSWGGQGGWSEHRFDDCIKTVKATLGRRNAVLRPESERVLRAAFEVTSSQRQTFLQKYKCLV